MPAQRIYSTLLALSAAFASFAHASFESDVASIGRALPTYAHARDFYEEDWAWATVEQKRARRRLIAGTLDHVEALVGRVESDELNRAYEGEAYRQIALYNDRERRGARPPDFRVMNERREAFKAKYREQFQIAQLALALKYPNAVYHVAAADPLPHVIFNPVSRIDELVDWDVLSQSAQGHIRGHRMTYLPWTVAARLILGHLRRDEPSVTACEDTLAYAAGRGVRVLLALVKPK